MPAICSTSSENEKRELLVTKYFGQHPLLVYEYTGENIKASHVVKVPVDKGNGGN